jgi:dTDP-4-dehydrorhamnose 3,5-epimerase-like enzyme
VLYAITTTYNPASAYSLKYLDLTLNIDWPIPVSVVSKKDAEGLSLAEAVDLFKDYK